MIGIEITVIAVAYVAFSVTLQRKLIDTKRMRKIQAEIRVKSKELTELSKAKADTSQLMAKQKEVTTLMGESMRSSFKPTLVILPIFIVLYYLVFPAIFPTNPSVTVLSSTMNYRYYFFLVTLVLGLAISVIILVYDNAKMKKEVIELKVEEAEKPC